MRKFVTLSLLMASLAISACNTVKGLGNDIESVGKTGEDVIH